MGISDWSSDVCSSDLTVDERLEGAMQGALADRRLEISFAGAAVGKAPGAARIQDLPTRRRWCLLSMLTKHESHYASGKTLNTGNHSLENLAYPFGNGVGRSEEHTSELQSLMRISYAVFCLK